MVKLIQHISVFKKRLAIKTSYTLVVWLYFVGFGTFNLQAQVTTKVDTTTIRIGEQISYRISVETDSTNLVVFPEGQTFMPLETVEISEVDTTVTNQKVQLWRQYNLTKFDSGKFTVPQQKIIINNTPFLTDSLSVQVNTIAVDTTKQKLYDIKPILAVDKTSSNWLRILAIVLLCLVVLAGILYWFIWRKKPLTEDEEIALLPPFERAQMQLQKLEEHKYLERAELKAFYSELTLILRRYLDEKVYDRALESTTNELVAHLQLLTDANQIQFSKQTLQNIASILKRADLVKFAKSKPDVALAELDKTTIAKTLTTVKAALPEPDEEEKLLDIAYKEAQARQQKRKKIILTSVITVAVLVATYVGFGATYGFTYVNDTITQHQSKKLLEGKWYKSAYGYPPVWVETPQVLKRSTDSLPKQLADKLKKTEFKYGNAAEGISIAINTLKFKAIPDDLKLQTEDQKQAGIDILKYSEASIQLLEKAGFTDILVTRNQYTTPNGAEGLKTEGSFKIVNPNTKQQVDAKYSVFLFTAQNIIQEIILTWPNDDAYANDIITRVINSIELKSDEQVEAEQQNAK